MTALLTAFDGSRLFFMSQKVNKIRWNTQRIALSRRKQGFDSPWGHQELQSECRDFSGMFRH